MEAWKKYGRSTWYSIQAGTYMEKIMEFIKDDLTAYALYILLLSGHQQVFARKTAGKGKVFYPVR
jgi:hypothetical protein